MSFRVVTVGDSGQQHVTQYHFLDQATPHYDIAAKNAFWRVVELQVWVEGAGFWHPFKVATPRTSADWHATPLTHSYA